MTLVPLACAADAETAYLANSNYEANVSTLQCQAFIQACRALLLFRPSRATRNSGREAGVTMEWALENIKAELTQAKQWLAFSGDGQADGGVTFPSFSEARDYDSGYIGGGARAEPYGDSA